MTTIPDAHRDLLHRQVAGWGMRASGKDRESVVAVLRDAYTAGRLTLDEFDERTPPRTPARPGAPSGS